MADSANVVVPDLRPGGGGLFFRAPLGTTLPVDAATPLEPAYLDHGYCGDDGIVNSISRETQDVYAYGGDVVASPQQTYAETYQVTLLEDSNLVVLRTVFGDDNVTDVGGLVKVRHNKAKLPRSVFVADTATEDGGLQRQIIEIGQVDTVGDITRVHTDVIRYVLTIKSYPNSDGDTLIEYRESDDGS